MVIIFMALIPSIAHACSILVGGFYSFPFFWPVLLATATAGGFFGYRWLKNYPRKQTKKKIRPSIAALASILIAGVFGFLVFVFWPGYVITDVCQVGWKLESHCVCVSPDGKAEKPKLTSPITINPKARLSSLKSMVNQEIEQQSGYRDPSLLKPFER